MRNEEYGRKISVCLHTTFISNSRAFPRVYPSFIGATLSSMVCSYYSHDLINTSLKYKYPCHIGVENLKPTKKRARSPKSICAKPEGQVHRHHFMHPRDTSCMTDAASQPHMKVSTLLRRSAVCDKRRSTYSAPCVRQAPHSIQHSPDLLTVRLSYGVHLAMQAASVHSPSDNGQLLLLI